MSRLAAALVTALGVGAAVPATSTFHTRLSAGTMTVDDASGDAFGQPSPFLDAAGLRTFFVGNSLFNQTWVGAPASVSERDGLGPLFNARSCSGCHLKDGRGAPPRAGSSAPGLLIRVSTSSSSGPGGAPVGDPTYGDQIQGLALPGIRPEADVVIDYHEIGGAFDDGDAYSLRRPRYRFEHLGYGSLTPGARLSPRVAPALIGLGLLEAVPEADVLRASDPDDADGDGISGRPNRVPVAGRSGLALGRFGWKAEQPTVKHQVAGALSGDLGLTTSLFPRESRAERQAELVLVPSGGAPEVGDRALDALALYSRSLGVPARRYLDLPEVSRGEALFEELGCSGCHTPTWRTAPTAELPDLPRDTIHPYTDLLLHDLGEGLADDRPTYVANGREWRTAPLWGIGLLRVVSGHVLLLHDGRARGFVEAVLWHGGEAEAARRAFTRLPRDERRALVAFLESL